MLSWVEQEKKKFYNLDSRLNASKKKKYSIPSEKIRKSVVYIILNFFSEMMF